MVAPPDILVLLVLLKLLLVVASVGAGLRRLVVSDRLHSKQQYCWCGSNWKNMSRIGKDTKTLINGKVTFNLLRGHLQGRGSEAC